MSYSSVTRFKRCSKCKTEYPRTFQFFGRDKNLKRGLHVQCRLCRLRSDRLAWLMASLFTPPGHRACTKCAAMKPATEEHFAVEGGRMRSDCKRCKNGRFKGWYADNREANIRRVVEYNKNNPKRKAYMVDYLRAWHREHPNYGRDKTRRWRANLSPEGLEQERLRSRELGNRRRAIKALAASEDVAPVIIKQMYEDQQGLCAYCETPLFGTYHIDHMEPISRMGSHHWSNFAIACPTCNLRKGAKTAVEFLATLGYSVVIPEARMNSS